MTAATASGIHAMWLTAQGVADELSLDKASVYALVRDGRLPKYAPHVRGGRFRVEDVERIKTSLRPDRQFEEWPEPIGPKQRGEPYTGPIDRRREAFLYAIEIIGVCCKVGITHSPRSRLTTHSQQAARFDRSTGRIWLSWPHIEAPDNERVLIAGAPNEYLKRSFDEVVEIANALPMERWIGPHAPDPVLYADISVLKQSRIGGAHA